MPTNYPGALDVWTNPTANDTMDGAVGGGAVAHYLQHSNHNDAISAIQGLLGVTPVFNFQGYIPGIVTGLTDSTTAANNYTAINNYITDFMSSSGVGGLPLQLLPPGRTAISQTLTLPSGFYLAGTGPSVTESTYNAAGPGSFLCPQNSGFSGNQLVHLNAPNTGCYNLTLDATAKINSGIQVDAGQCFMFNTSVARGLGATFDSTTNTQSLFMGGLWDIRPGTQDNAPTALNALGADWIVTGGRITHGSKFISVNGGLWNGVHFTHSSASPGNYNVSDGGGSIYSGCYFDSCSPDASALILASGESEFSGCRYYQNIAAVTGIPVFSCSSSTLTVNGGWLKVSGAGSYFSAFASGASSSDLFSNINCEPGFGALGTSPMFTSGSPGTARGNIVNNIPQLDYGSTGVTPITVTAVANAGAVAISSRVTNFVNNSAATMTITMAVTNAQDGQESTVRIFDATAAAQTIVWGGSHTENSTGASVPTTSGGSTTLPLTVRFQFNGATGKWRCMGVS